eukprot:TRINITY_DN9992_c0_g2_i6.p1 TRINITY_DN9992_c0_g2~~TRINITY_DN9992_c0_g2_i6.p1  ORF type:complete len:296 (+),score=64.36 TRINITY_DN9992_c0_g2_i6:73-960(+)
MCIRDRYRTANDKVQKGQLKIGDVSPEELVVNEQRCFCIEENNRRQFVFLDNGNGRAFVNKAGCLICLKKYYNDCIADFAPFSKEAANFLSEPSQTAFSYNESFANETLEHIADSLKYHPKLQQLALVRCQLTDKQLEILKDKLTPTITVLNLSSNKLTHKSAKIFNDLIKSQDKLVHVILDDNLLTDVTVQEIAQGLDDRYNRLAESKKSGVCLLEVLSLKNTGMSDKGLISLVHVFDTITSKVKARSISGGDTSKGLRLNIGCNDIMDNGMKTLSHLLTTFNGIASLNISNSA